MSKISWCPRFPVPIFDFLGIYLPDLRRHLLECAKNSLFYKTRNGARRGDLFISLIHTCELNGINPSDYLTELQRHAEELKRAPAEWMPWNYRETLAQLATFVAA